jgi:hypothetical protein
MHAAPTTAATQYMASADGVNARARATYPPTHEASGNHATQVKPIVIAENLTDDPCR